MDAVNYYPQFDIPCMYSSDKENACNECSKLRMEEDNAGMFPGESRIIPICGICGCKEIFKQTTGAIYRLKKCPQCGHVLNWSLWEGRYQI